MLPRAWFRSGRGKGGSSVLSPAGRRLGCDAVRGSGASADIEIETFREGIHR